MTIPDYVWAHLAGWFLSFMSVMGFGWFTALSKRVSTLEEEVEYLERELASKSKTIERLRHKLGGLGVEPSEVEDD